MSATGENFTVRSSQNEAATARLTFPFSTIFLSIHSIFGTTHPLLMHKNILLTIGILIISSAINGQGIAQTYDANEAFKANELGGNENTPLFGPFSLGYAENFGDFTPYSAAEHTNNFAGNADTQGFLTINNVIVPAAVVNVSTTPFSGFSGLNAGEILLHPGGRGPNGFAGPLFDSVLRFTAPTTGVYAINGNFRSLDGGITENTLLHNATPLVTIINEGGFAFSIKLVAGDRIDFSAGPGPDNIGGDSTGLTVSLSVAPPQIVNIDFNGKRPGDGDSAGTFIGSGAAGGGSLFNGITADSTGGNDNLTVSGFHLLTDAGTPTTVGFTISPVGGDHEPGQPFEPASLYDDYIFNNSAGNNTPGGSPFTISGLGGATTADVYLYGSFDANPDFVIAGYSGSGVFGVYNGLNATAYLGVPVSGGAITGFFGVGATGVLGGLTIVTPVGLPLPLQWINIDFDGLRPGDASSAGTYVGLGATGGGTLFNTMAADSTGGDDNLTVSGFNLLSGTGSPTTVGFTIGPVGGDHEPNQPFGPASLFDDYIFNNSAGNSTPGGSPFTISGLGGAATVDIYLYGSYNTSPDFVIDGYAGSAIFETDNGLNTTVYLDVPVTGGEITGLFGVNETGILGGLTVVLSPDLHFTEVTWAADEVSLTFTTTSGLHYQVQSSNDLLTWYPLGTMQLATGETLTVVDPNATVEQRFYRAIVSE